MIRPDESAIRERAQAIWERDGRPTGRDRDHWLQAAWELAGEVARAAALNKPEESAADNPTAKRRKGAGTRTRSSKQ